MDMEMQTARERVEQRLAFGLTPELVNGAWTWGTYCGIPAGPMLHDEVEAWMLRRVDR